MDFNSNEACKAFINMCDELYIAEEGLSDVGNKIIGVYKKIIITLKATMQRISTKLSFSNRSEGLYMHKSLERAFAVSVINYGKMFDKCYRHESISKNLQEVEQSQEYRKLVEFKETFNSKNRPDRGDCFELNPSFTNDLKHTIIVACKILEKLEKENVDKDDPTLKDRINDLRRLQAISSTFICIIVLCQ